MAGSQDFATDPRNEAARVWLNGELVRKEDAKVSIFDAGFVVGDGVWEGLRLHRGRLVFLETHLDRLFAGAAAIGLDIGMSRTQVVAALDELLEANGMEDGVHLRLMVTRGNVIRLCEANGIPLALGDFPLEDCIAADEAFVTGTFGGLTPVREIDGRTLPLSLPGPVTTRLRALYEALKDAEAVR